AISLILSIARPSRGGSLRMLTARWNHIRELRVPARDEGICCKKKKTPSARALGALNTREIGERSVSRARDVFRSRTFSALHEVEFHRLALCQRLEAVALNRAVMHETVSVAAIGRDESESFRVVEPLHLTGRA